MRKLKERELLSKICREHKLHMKMVSELLKSASKFSYENTSDTVRQKDYGELIDYYGRGEMK